jgi:uncharacterized membrane protein
LPHPDNALNNNQIPVLLGVDQYTKPLTNEFVSEVVYLNKGPMRRSREIDKFRAIEQKHHEKLRRIVDESIKEERLINQTLMHPEDEPLTFGQKIADKIASFGGSWRFILTFSFVLLAWVIFNTVAIAMKFDPFPFILMNLFLSTIAAFQGPFIMMSQNRQEEKDRGRAENDYLVNLKAEMEIRSLHQKIDLMVKEQMKTLYEAQAEQLMLLKQIDQRISGNSIGVKEEKTT